MKHILIAVAALFITSITYSQVQVELAGGYCPNYDIAGYASLGGKIPVIRDKLALTIQAEPFAIMRDDAPCYFGGRAGITLFELINLSAGGYYEKYSDNVTYTDGTKSPFPPNRWCLMVSIKGYVYKNYFIQGSMADNLIITVGYTVPKVSFKHR